MSYFPVFIPTSQNCMKSFFLCPHCLFIPVSLTAPSGQFSPTSISFTGLPPLLIPAAEQKAVCFVAFPEAMQKLLFWRPSTLVLTGQLFLLNPFRTNQTLMTVFLSPAALMWPHLYLLHRFTLNVGSFEISFTTFA